MIEKRRAYLTTGELYTNHTDKTALPEQKEHIILWLRNYGTMFQRDEAQRNYGFKLEFGSAPDEGGSINFYETTPTRSNLSESLFQGIPREFSGEGHLRTPESRHPDDEVFVRDQFHVETSFIDVGDQTAVDIEFAPSDPEGGGTVTLTDAQRDDLATFLAAGKLDEPRIIGNPTELVFPDGRVNSVDTKQLGEDPAQFLQIPVNMLL